MTLSPKEIDKMIVFLTSLKEQSESKKVRVKKADLVKEFSVKRRLKSKA